MKFPVVPNFKYLGLMIDDCLKLDINLDAKKEKEQKLL